jgi:magnesium-transporting ATPase (P-type)
MGTQNLGPLEAGAVTEITRDAAEKDLIWIGLLLFRNELKADTAGAIMLLREGAVRYKTSVPHMHTKD